MCVGPITAPTGPSSPGASRALRAPISRSSSASTVRRSGRQRGPASKPSPLGTGVVRRDRRPRQRRGRRQRRLNGAALGIRRARHDQQAAARLCGPGDKRPHRAEAEVGMDGDRVGRERGALAQVRLGVGVVRRPDVAALDIEDDEQPGAAGPCDQPVQRADATPAVPLEERRLRLDQPDRPGRGRQHDVGEPVEPVRAIAKPPALQQGGGRIQAEDQRPMSRPDSREPACKGFRHGAIFA